MEAGAQAILALPHGLGHADFEATARELVQTVKLMSEVKVIRRWAHSHAPAVPPVMPGDKLQQTWPEIRVIALGASTGGPLVLQTIVSRLPRDLPVPVLLVQHMTPGFVHGFVTWLAQSTPLGIHVACHDETLLPGHIYVAPDGYHMGVTSAMRIGLSQEPPEHGARPSVSYLFRSVAHVFKKRAVGVLLTGMGKDGAEELKYLQDTGAVTIAQDKASSVVHGMPGEAIRLDAATYVLPPESTAQFLISLVTRRDRHEARPHPLTLSIQEGLPNADQRFP
jgi:two-component system chemotaxis response regulator CheB